MMISKRLNGIENIFAPWFGRKTQIKEATWKMEVKMQG
jgi:hypothetical protein